MFSTLQSCRAFAAMLVVCFHLGGTIALTKYFGVDWVSRPFAFGHAGVDFFFVLSGFIIIHVHQDDFGWPSQLGNYFKKRLIRIYPVYWMVFFAVGIAALPFSSLRETLPSDPAIIFKALLLMPQDRAVVGGTGAPLLGVAWSLQYEILFYGAVASFIVNRWLGAALVVVFAVLFLWQPFGVEFPYNFIQSDWLLLFGMGAMVAVVNRRALDVRWPLAWALLGLLIFLGNGLQEVLDPALEVGRTEHLIYGVGSAMMIFGLIRAEAAGIAGAFKPRWATLLGDASYALYLIHFPLISLVCKIAIAVGFSGVWGSIATFLIGVIACVAVSILFHLYLEKPLLRYLGTKLESPRHTSVARGVS
ncbi:MAG: acyltransferase [Hydrogenophaga sp.]|nr:acyltransferase [Hydrogenophaga sp.]